jgi:hypothetical protein
MWGNKGNRESFQECFAERSRFKMQPVTSSSDPRVKYDISGVVDKGELKCTCPGFGFRGTCKHLKVWTEICEWNEIDSEEKQTEGQRKNHVCPRCGGETMDVG